MRRAAALAAAAVLLGALGACGGKAGPAGPAGPSAVPAPRVSVVVSAPLSTDPFVGNGVRDGAQLAVDQLNAGAGQTVGGVQVQYVLDVKDNAGSPSQAVDIARQAVSDHAAALVTDGVGAAAVSAVTLPAQLPVFVTFDGGSSVVDPVARPNVYRIAPADAVMARRLTDYLAAKAPSVALFTEDTSYGKDGATALRAALVRDKLPLVADTQVVTGVDPAPGVVAALAKRPTAIIIWASGSAVIGVLKALKGAGSTVPVYTSPSGEDPIVRQALGAAVDGVTIVSFRITAEVGPVPYAAWRAAYEQRFGVEQVGVTVGGKPVVQPPDYAMFSYDAVKLLAAAVNAAGLPIGTPLTTALDSTSITGANGDEYGFTPGSREGVSQGDIAFSTFVDQKFVPVTDDTLGPKLPTVSQ